MDEVRYTWADRELPLLRESVRMIDAGQAGPEMRYIADTCGIDWAQAEVAFEALEEDDFLELDGRGMGPLNGHVARVTGKARRELEPGQPRKGSSINLWPR